MLKLINTSKLLLLTLSIFMLNTSAFANNGQGNGKSNKDSHFSQGQGNGKSGKIHKNHVKNNQGKKSKVGFSEVDKTAVAHYLSANPIPTASLPPGIAKNLARGKKLPPGIAKAYLPQHLEAQLPAYPGYEYLVANKEVLLVNKASGVVADILSLTRP
jgi:hypothetical protein